MLVYLALGSGALSSGAPSKGALDSGFFIQGRTRQGGAPVLNLQPLHCLSSAGVAHARCNTRYGNHQRTLNRLTLLLSYTT